MLIGYGVVNHGELLAINLHDGSCSPRGLISIVIGPWLYWLVGCGNDHEELMILCGSNCTNMQIVTPWLGK